MAVTKERPSARTTLAVDFPRQGEHITTPQYTLRLTAPEDVAGMEVSVDQGAWQPCRKSVGYWWYDWSGYDNGEHEVVARVQTGNGKEISCEPHEFFVQLAPAA